MRGHGIPCPHGETRVSPTSLDNRGALPESCNMQPLPRLTSRRHIDLRRVTASSCLAAAGL
ncbi:putative leader peptide [Streptomyces sp. 6N223]|uniref:putative leader peptide n=1 Tax=Streptomyces sp. 6N223 TaxID=3457412 RepID=UPI003FCFB973